MARRVATRPRRTMRRSRSNGLGGTTRRRGGRRPPSQLDSAIVGEAWARSPASGSLAGTGRWGARARPASRVRASVGSRRSSAAPVDWGLARGGTGGASSPEAAFDPNGCSPRPEVEDLRGLGERLPQAGPASSSVSTRLQNANRTRCVPSSGGRRTTNRARRPHRRPSSAGSRPRRRRPSPGARRRPSRSRRRASGWTRTPSPRGSAGACRAARGTRARVSRRTTRASRADHPGSWRGAGAATVRKSCTERIPPVSASRGDDPADAPAGDRVGLRERADRDGPVLEPGHGAGRDVAEPVVRDVLVDLVGEHDHVPPLAQLRDRRRAPRARTPCRSGCSAC